MERLHLLSRLPVVAGGRWPDMAAGRTRPPALRSFPLFTARRCSSLCRRLRDFSFCPFCPFCPFCQLEARNRSIWSHRRNQKPTETGPVVFQPLSPRRERRRAAPAPPSKSWVLHPFSSPRPSPQPLGCDPPKATGGTFASPFRLEILLHEASVKQRIHKIWGLSEDSNTSP